jgi:hypothetical protein
LENEQKCIDLLLTIKKKVDLNKSLILTLGPEFDELKELISHNSYQHQNSVTDIENSFKSQSEANLLFYISLVKELFPQVVNQITGKVKTIIRLSFFLKTIFSLHIDYSIENH